MPIIFPNSIIFLFICVINLKQLYLFSTERKRGIDMDRVISKVYLLEIKFKT